MNTVINLNDRTQFYASDELLNKLLSKISKDDTIVNFAYTDYGGDFFDKVAIEFFIKEYPLSIVCEDTIHSGKNAFIFGDVAKEFIEETENYLLSFDYIEDFYFDKQYQQETEDFQRFLDDIEMYDDYKINPNALDYLLENRSGYYNITTHGLDFCESELIGYCINAGIIAITS